MARAGADVLRRRLSGVQGSHARILSRQYRRDPQRGGAGARGSSLRGQDAYHLEVRTLSACALSWPPLLAIAEPKYVDDPDKHAAEVVPNSWPRVILRRWQRRLPISIGKPDSADSLKNALGMLGGKPIDYSDKVIDNTFGKGLRQIVYYSYVVNIGFVDHRFNFKMSSKGWILANFNFKTETNELFPKDFVDR